MARMRRASAACPLLLLACSCATVLQGSRQTLAIDSEPEGAKVYLNGLRIGTTPMRVEAQASKDYSFEFRLEGYETRSMKTADYVGAGWVALDVYLVLTIFLSWVIVIDALTGDWFYFNGMKVVMQPLTSAPNAPPHAPPVQVPWEFVEPRGDT